MDGIQDSTRYSFQWPQESQDNDEGVPSGADHPSFSHTIDPDHLQHPQYDQAGTSFTPHPAHFPSTSGEYFPRNDDYHQLHPVVRPRAIPHDPANQWQYELYSPAVSSHPQTRQFPFDEPSSSYPQNREEYGNPTNLYSQPPHHTSEHAQETPLDYSSHRPYATSFSAYPETQRDPLAESHQPQFQPMVPPEAIPFDFWSQQQPEPAGISSHPETLHCPTIETSSQPPLVPFLDETSIRLKNDLVPLNHLMTSHPTMIIDQFRILPALERDAISVDDVLRCISFNENSDPQNRIQSFNHALRKYELGSLRFFYYNFLDHCRFERNTNSPNYDHLLKALDIISPLEQTYNLKRSSIGFCRSLHYFTHRPRVSRSQIARDFGMDHDSLADMIVQFSRETKTANIGVIEFINPDKYSGKFFEAASKYNARYYQWKPAQAPQVNLDLKLG